MYENVEKLNNRVSAKIKKELCFSSSFFDFKPTVGITSNPTEYGNSLANAYSKAIEAMGGIPLIIPITNDEIVLYNTLYNNIDGLLLSGGGDIYPYFMDEDPRYGLGSVSVDRDEYELKVIHIAEKLNIPILGICRGMQILGVAHGATMYQDIYNEYDKEQLINHNPPIGKQYISHSVTIMPDAGRISKILNIREGSIFYVNSIHHQALKDVAYPFKVVCRSSDGIIEAIDAYPEKDIIAVQWHPEQLLVGNMDDISKGLFINLIDRAKSYHRARRFHRENIVLDSHTDTPMLFTDDNDIISLKGALVDTTRMIMGDVHTTFMAVYLPQKELSDDMHRKAQNFTENKLSQIHQKVSQTNGIVVLSKNKSDVIESHRLGKKSVVVAIENGYAIGENIELLKHWREKYGITYMTLCHNGDNLICDSAKKSTGLNNGLSEFGHKVVREMESLGILVDISHLGEKSINDILTIAAKPVVASHSSARSLCDSPRNLTDDQLKKIALNGGVVQVCLYAGFINDDEKKATYLDAVNHIEHIINTIGVEYVGIGSDFDGDGELIGCRETNDLIRITIELINRGYNESDLSLIWGGNLLRIMP